MLKLSGKWGIGNIHEIKQLAMDILMKVNSDVFLYLYIII